MFEARSRHVAEFSCESLVSRTPVARARRRARRHPLHRSAVPHPYPLPAARRQARLDPGPPRAGLGGRGAPGQGAAAEGRHPRRRRREPDHPAVHPQALPGGQELAGRPARDGDRAFGSAPEPHRAAAQPQRLAARPGALPAAHHRDRRAPGRDPAGVAPPRPERGVGVPVVRHPPGPRDHVEPVPLPPGGARAWVQDLPRDLPRPRHVVSGELPPLHARVPGRAGAATARPGACGSGSWPWPTSPRPP